MLDPSFYFLRSENKRYSINISTIRFAFIVRTGTFRFSTKGLTLQAMFKLSIYVWVFCLSFKLHLALSEPPFILFFFLDIWK